MNSVSDSNLERQALLIKQLADGQFHSGESLGQLIGVSRAAVWKHIKVLEEMGIEFESIRGQGYRIPGGLILLDEQRIAASLSDEAKSFYGSFHVFREIDSTNQYLLNLSELGSADYAAICLAEKQSSGRGRRGRSWVSPFGKNIYCSILWRFNKPMSALDGLSLVVALSIYRVLQRRGLEEIKLKWPNDILSGLFKLAGILLEIRGDLTDYCDVVIGFGLNIHMPESFAVEIDQPWTDLNRLGMENPDRNVLLAEIFNQLAIDLREFELNGFAPFARDWNEADAFIGKRIKLVIGKDEVEGVSRGVDESGVLQMEVDGKLESFHGGEISLRAVESC